MFLLVELLRRSRRVEYQPLQLGGEFLAAFLAGGGDEPAELSVGDRPVRVSRALLRREPQGLHAGRSRDDGDRLLAESLLDQVRDLELPGRRVLAARFEIAWDDNGHGNDQGHGNGQYGGMPHDFLPSRDRAGWHEINSGPQRRIGA